MAYNYEYPYTDPNRYNSDWLLNKMRELSVEWATQQNDFVELKKYIDNYFKNLDVSAEVSAKIDELYNTGVLAELISNLKYRYLANKHVCIIGDSISDNTTNPPNWTVEFTNELSKVGATVTNVSQNGASFASWAKDIELAKIPKADIYILFLGINDFQGQWNWSGTVDDYSLYACSNKLFKAIVDKNTKARYYYVSPIKILRPEVANYKQPLIWYRSFLEKTASRYGFTVISGYNAPALSSVNYSYLGDTLHPTSEYGVLLSEYILNAITSGVSTFTANNIFTLELSPLTGEGFLNFYTDSTFNSTIIINLNNVHLTNGWNNIVELPNAAVNNVFLKQRNVYNRGSSKNYFIDISPTGYLQLYGDVEETISLTVSISFTNYWTVSHNE